MSKISTITLSGASGKQYAFNVYPIDQKFNDIGAVYYFSHRSAKPGDTHSHRAVYIGQSGDLSTRFDSHHKENCITSCDANCISVHQDGNEQSRMAKERDLIEKHDPPCNGQHGHDNLPNLVRRLSTKQPQYKSAQHYWGSGDTKLNYLKFLNDSYVPNSACLTAYSNGRSWPLVAECISLMNDRYPCILISVVRTENRKYNSCTILRLLYLMFSKILWCATTAYLLTNIFLDSEKINLCFRSKKLNTAVIAAKVYIK